MLQSHYDADHTVDSQSLFNNTLLLIDSVFQ